MSEPSAMRSRHATYYARREAQERAAADRSSDVAVRRLHLQLADRYSALLAPVSLAVA